MLSRSGLSIRKLIPHRRSSDEDLNGDILNEAIPRVSWTDQEDGGGSAYAVNRRSIRKRRDPIPIIATSSLVHSDILRPLPPLPIETPRSSASSSCRCERHADCDCPLLSWKRRSPLYSLSSNEDREGPTLVSCVSSSSPDDTLTSHIPKSRFCLPSDLKSKEDVARTSSPEGEQKEEGLKDRQSEEIPPQELSQDIQQFMQEAEDAFKAIGNTLAEVHVNRLIVPEATKPDSSDVPHELESPPPTPPPKEEGRRSLSKSPLAKTPSMLSSSPPSSPPKDNSPTQRPKRKKSKKSKQTRSMRSTRKPTAQKHAAKSGPRWTLSENVSELLTGKLFHRIEADEMLTPDQIEAFKQQRITKLQVDKMAAALEQELVVTPVEPFHLDDLPQRIGSAGVKASPEIQPAITFSEDMVQRDFSFERQRNSNRSPNPLKHRFPFHKNRTFPTTSPRHVRSSSRTLITGLAIIPEASPAPRTSDDLYFSNESDDSLGNSSTSDYVYLKSSPYSVNTPSFQHGPIRLSKSDLASDMRLGADDDLDWTAYQMAVLGGAGDLFSESDDALRQQEDEEIADIVEWWDSFHFESTGELVTREYEAPSPTSTLSGDEIPDLSYSEIESDNPYSPHQRWQEARHKTSIPGLQLDLDFTKGKNHPPAHYIADGQGTMSDTWRRDSEEKKLAVDRRSINSLPPSPMLDLRVIRSGNGDDLDVVPMGYNLGHDLGDFLKWEAQHAYAGDFNAPSGIM
ncbi:hypothetical protein NUW58_g2939 [Xylaria curta]|uniref:Uncharacterized protein n=1 Tax=Xylaria curta TaxID=42375 RepID=A0ACC1PD96_9PEZI|nr:hypothetical protein NUW58_g2939 [Xylaria curta]